MTVVRPDNVQQARILRLLRAGPLDRTGQGHFRPGPGRVPRRIVLNAPVVTAENVEEYTDQCFES
jgi:hypothetical protein